MKDLLKLSAVQYNKLQVIQVSDYFGKHVTFYLLRNFEHVSQVFNLLTIFTCLKFTSLDQAVNLLFKTGFYLFGKTTHYLRPQNSINVGHRCVIHHFLKFSIALQDLRVHIVGENF